MYENATFLLLMYIEIVLLLVSLIYLQVCKHLIKGKIEVPISISESGKNNLTKITVNNKSRLIVVRMKVCVIVEDTLSRYKKKYWMKLPACTHGEMVFIKSIVFPGTGNYEVTLKKLRIYDMTGLLYGNVKVNQTESVQIMPEMYDVSVRMTLATKNFYGEADVYDENSPGHDQSELFQVREYQKGDRLQNIHWKLTAKQGEIMVKENSLPKSCPVILFLNYHTGQRSKKNRDGIAFMEAAASISFSMMAVGCPHYVVWFDKDETDIVRVRVDDEESLFYFISMLMKIKWEIPREELFEKYKEKGSIIFSVG